MSGDIAYVGIQAERPMHWCESAFISSSIPTPEWRFRK